MLRVIVSGSRYATEAEHLEVIGAALQAICRRDLGVLAHGDAAGVDRIAAECASTWGWQVKAVPAAWPTCDLTVPADLGGCPDWPHRKRRPDGTDYCPYAGHRRNQALVDLSPRPDHVLVFPAAGPVARSRGTWDLHRRARRAGLLTTVCPLELELQ